MTKIFKKMFAVMTTAIIALTAVIMPVSAEGEELTYGPMTYEILEDGTVAITSCDQSVTSIEIPSQIDGRPVTVLDGGCFWWCDKLTSVKIPDSVKSIESSAFSYCSGITEVDFGSGLEYIGSSSFDYCHSLTSITIPENVTYINWGAFAYCSGLKEVIIEDGVTWIGDDAFMNCESLEYVDLGDSLEFLDYGAFRGCTSLEAIVLPDSLTGLEAYTFSGCTSLSTVTLPSNLTYIDYGCFKDCSSLAEIDIPLSVQSIGIDAFTGTAAAQGPETGLVIVDDWVVDYNGRAINENQTLVIDDNIRGIADSALLGCECTTAYIGTGVKYIGELAMAHCSLMTELTFAGDVLTIGDAAFEDCGGIYDIDLPNSVVYLGQNAFYGTGYYENCEDGVVYLEDWAVDYKGEMPENTSITIKDGTYGIAGATFYMMENLSSITVPEGVVVIGDTAFMGCTSLNSVTLPETLEVIGDDAFCDCTALTELTIPASVNMMGETSVGFTYETTNRDIMQMENFTIKGWTGSLAEFYAEIYGFNFVSLGEAEYRYYLLGDIDNNGAVEVADAVLLKKYLLAKETFDAEQALLADINCDDIINVFDLVLLKRMILA